MGWYSDLKENDWFQAIKDVGDGVSTKYEELKHQEAPARQAQVLTQTESTQNVDAQLWDAKASGNAQQQQQQQQQQQESGGINPTYLMAGGAALVGLLALILAVR